jgi:hypothetical protein
MIVADVRTGAKHTGVDKPTHVKGIKQGNSRGNYDRQPGHNEDGTSSAERSTGIDAASSQPIDPSMPNLSPG